MAQQLTGLKAAQDTEKVAQDTEKVAQDTEKAAQDTERRRRSPSARAVLNRALERWPWATLDGRASQLVAELPNAEKWEVTGAYKGRLPGPLESDLYVSLHALWDERGQPTDGVLRIPTRELLRRMGKGDGGGQYAALEDGLARLAAVRFVGRSVLPSGRKRLRLFGLIDDADVTEDGTTEVRLSRALCTAMATEGRGLDATRYFALERPIARRLYRYLDYRRQRGAKAGAIPELSLPLRELAAELPIRRATSRDQRRTLNPAHGELTAAGFLSGAKYVRHGRGLWSVVYHFGSGTQVAPSQPSPVSDGIADRVERAMRELRDPTSAGFYAGAVQALGLDAFDFELGRIREQLRDGLDVATARKFFTAAVKRRTGGAGTMGRGRPQGTP